MSLTRITILAALAGWTTACSVSEPLSVQSLSNGLAPDKVALRVAEGDAGTERGRFAAALVQAFSQQSFVVDPNGSSVADYAFSLGDAADGVARGDAPSTDPDWLAQPRKAGRFDKCDAKRMRGTLVLMNRNSGTQVYRGNASRVECDFSDEDVAAMADALVRDAITRAQQGS